VNKFKNELAVGLLLVVAGVMLGWMALNVGAISGVRDGMTLTFRMPDAAGLQDGASVAVAGVEIGRLEGLALDGPMALATVRLQRSAAIPMGSRVRVRQRSLLGEKYLEVIPEGMGAAWKDGDVIEVKESQLELDELIYKIGPLIDAVDVDALAKLLGRASAALEDDPEAFTRWFKDLETLLRNAAEASEGFPQLTQDAQVTLADARRALRVVESRGRELEQTIDRADEALALASDLAPDAKAALEDAQRALAQARELLEGMEGVDENLATVLANFAEIDKYELRRLLREEGILIRTRKKEVVVPE